MVITTYTYNTNRTSDGHNILHTLITQTKYLMVILRHTLITQTEHLVVILYYIHL